MEEHTTPAHEGSATQSPTRPLGGYVRALLVVIGVPCMIAAALGAAGALTTGVFSGFDRLVVGAISIVVGAIGIASVGSAVTGRWYGAWRWIDGLLR